jgi:hypothetical protein
MTHPNSRTPSHEMNLRPWRLIAKELEQRHGMKLSAARVMQICQIAEVKIATGLRACPHHRFDSRGG